MPNKTCEKEGCNSFPSFNYEGQRKRRFCVKHKEDNMVNVKDKLCYREGCNHRNPSFNYEGETRGKFCSKHKEDNMVDVKNKKCNKEGCKISPSFNYEGETKGLYCDKHKEDNMINVISKTCEKDGCNIIHPSFNYKGETKGKFCSKHKEDNMVDIKSKICEKEGCNTIPYFNYKGETKGIFCAKHKEDNMVDIKNKICKKEGCKTKPSFNYEGENRGIYCRKHKKYKMVDVFNKKCENKECNTICTFGYCGLSPSHCAQHKIDYMVRNPKRTCVGNDEEDCKDVAVYGKNEPLHCEDHKLDGEICWLIKKCDNCGRNKELLNKYNLCGFCTDVPFYEESKRINKVKESKMIKYLKENIKDFQEILADKIIDSTCNLYRPDILYDCGTHIVVVECDENQHKNYPWESCSLNRSLEHMEEKRMYEIMVAYGLPAIFIRWNPDNFKVKNNKKYSIYNRLEILVKWVNYCVKMKVSSGVVYKKLFYDEYEEEDICFKKINETELL